MKKLVDAATALLAKVGDMPIRENRCLFREWCELEDALRHYKEEAEVHASALCNLSHTFTFDSTQARVCGDAAGFLRGENE